jgi:leader peptidase (prepilin peptidase) / N-methyltransferase
MMITHAASTLPLDVIIMGIIVSLVFGASAGNYACSLVHRLPRGLGILEKKPYCGSCGTMLATKDLFPLVSALLLNHKCRYCGAAIPKTHFYTEVLLAALFVFCFLRFGFSEQYFLVALLGSMLTVLGSIEVNEGTVDKRVLVAVVVVGMMFRILQDYTIYDSFFGGVLALVVGCGVFYKRMEKRGHVYVPPLIVLLMGACGLIAGLPHLILSLALFALLALLFKMLCKGQRLSLTVPFGFAVIASVLV